MSHPHAPILQPLGRGIRSAARSLWRALAAPPVSLVIDPARVGDSSVGRPIVLIPGRILVLRRDVPRDRH